MAKQLSVAAGLTLAVLAGLGLSRLQDRRHARPSPTAYTTATNQRQAAGTEDVGAPPPRFVGVVLMGESVQVEPKSEGRIQEILLRVGDRVARGDIIARLDTRSLERDLKMQMASAKAAQARLRRRIPLSRGRLSAVTAEELDSARYEALREQEKVKQLQQAVAEGIIRAPFAGTVTERYLSPGAMSGPGRPVIRLLGQDKPRVRFAVPEQHAAGIAAGMPVEMNLDSLSVRATGVVASVNPEIDPASRMVYALADLSVAGALERRLTSGLIARVLVGRSSGRSATDLLERGSASISK